VNNAFKCDQEDFDIESEAWIEVAFKNTSEAISNLPAFLSQKLTDKDYKTLKSNLDPLSSESLQSLFSKINKLAELIDNVGINSGDSELTIYNFLTVCKREQDFYELRIYFNFRLENLTDIIILTSNTLSDAIKYEHLPIELKSPLSDYQIKSLHELFESDKSTNIEELNTIIFYLKHFETDITNYYEESISNMLLNSILSSRYTNSDEWIIEYQSVFSNITGKQYASLLAELDKIQASLVQNYMKNNYQIYTLSAEDALIIAGDDVNIIEGVRNFPIRKRKFSTPIDVEHVEEVPVSIETISLISTPIITEEPILENEALSFIESLQNALETKDIKKFIIDRGITNLLSLKDFLNSEESSNINEMDKMILLRKLKT